MVRNLVGTMIDAGRGHSFPTRSRPFSQHAPVPLPAPPRRHVDCSSIPWISVRRYRTVAALIAPRTRSNQNRAAATGLSTACYPEFRSDAASFSIFGILARHCAGRATAGSRRIRLAARESQDHHGLADGAGGDPRAHAESRRAREWLAERFTQAGLSSIEIDAAGNVLGILPAANMPAREHRPSRAALRAHRYRLSRRAPHSTRSLMATVLKLRAPATTPPAWRECWPSLARSSCGCHERRIRIARSACRAGQCGRRG